METGFDQQIPVSGIDGSRLDFRVVYVVRLISRCPEHHNAHSLHQHEQDRVVLFRAAQRAFAWCLGDPPHAADMYDNGTRSMFLDWMRRYDAGGTAYDQGTLRWRTLLFDSRRVPGVGTDCISFEAAVRLRVVRYGNNVVIHGACCPF